jgi:GH24 family phage-related lysozyme (muramidase)
MAAENAPLAVTLTANTTAFEKEIAKAFRGMQRELDTLKRNAANNDNIMPNVGRGAQQATDSIKKTTQAAGQLSFQLNDIATSLAGGSSPFTVMMQQGSQITQVFNQIAAGGGSLGSKMATIGKAMGGALLSMINPISIITFGLIAATGYAVQFFTSSEDGAEKAAKAAEKHVGELRKIADAYRGLVPVLDEYVRKLEASANKRANLDSLKDQIKSVQAELDSAWKGMNVGDTTASLFTKIGQNAGAAAESVQGELLRAVTEFQEAQVTGIGIEEKWAKLVETVTRLEKQYGQGSTEATQALNLMGAATAQTQKYLEGLLKTLGLVNANLEESVKVINEAVTAYGNLAALPPLATDAAGNWVNAGELQQSTAAINSQNAALKTSYDLIRKFEGGFQETPFWDKNHLRIGWSSDTVTDAQGNIREVTAGMRTTIEDADRDLYRRIGESRTKAIRELGQQTYNAMNEDQKAVLDSLIYNYGKIPPAVANAIRSGASSGEVGSAIASLTANASRRKDEGRIFAGGSPDFKEPEKAKTDFNDWKVSEEQRQALMEKRIALENDLSLTEAQRAAKLEYYVALEEGLTAARKQGLEINDAVRASIEKEAQARSAQVLALETAKTKQDEFNKSRQDLANQAQQFDTAVQGALGGLIKDLVSGKSAAESFSNALAKVADAALNIALQMAFTGLFGGGTGGGGGGLLSLLGVAHKGGIVGKSAFPTRRVNPAVFAGAERMHSGGVVGLRTGEVPIIAQRGEIILPKGATGGAGMGGSVTNNIGNISVDMSKSGAVAADTQSGRDLGIMISKSVQAIIIKESRPGGLLRQAPLRS